MLVARSLHPRYLSNAYLVADEEGGAPLYADSGAAQAAPGGGGTAVARQVRFPDRRDVIVGGSRIERE